MSRFARMTATSFLLAGAVFPVTAIASQNFPARIDLPSGWRAEGIAVGRGSTFYAGDTVTGAVYKGDLRTGEGFVLVPGQAGRTSFGIFADNRDRLFVAGGRTGHAYVFDARTGALIADYTLTTEPSFINDVYATRSGAYFTNTVGAPVLFRIPIAPDGELGSSAETFHLTPPAAGLNGIEATADEKTLVVVSITTGQFFTVDPITGLTREIVFSEPVPRGDGLILHGSTLYVVQNMPAGDIAVVELDPDLSFGEVIRRINSADDPLVSPATADRFGRLIYVVRRDVPGGTVFHLTRLEAPTGGD